MLFFLLSCLSFLLVSQSFLKQNSIPKSTNSRMWAFPWISCEESHRFFMLLHTKRKVFTRVLQVPSIKRLLRARFEVVEKVEEEKDEFFSLLDLPDLALDSILEKLSPAELCSMAGVCSSLRENCTSDYLWEKQMKNKWGRLIGDAAYKEWQSQIASRRGPKFSNCQSNRSKLQFFLDFFRYKSGKIGKKSDSKSYSIKSCYLALETGRFWFPAQVFNREVQNGHVGFMLSCYDAQLSYDSTADNFIARYRAQGRSMIEEGIEWNRIRAPTVETPSNVLHTSDCLNELKPGDHIEVQWRKNKDFPYGWWYGVVGHMDYCNGNNEFNCHCHINDRVMLVFKQYSPESRWRKTMVSRKDHAVMGNEADGFYGGIRKLHKKEEIGKWKELWPDCTLG